MSKRATWGSGGTGCGTTGHPIIHVLFVTAHKKLIYFYHLNTRTIIGALAPVKLPMVKEITQE